MQIPDIVRRLLAKASAAANPQPSAGSRTWSGFVWTEELLRAKKLLDEAPLVLLTGEAGTGKSTFIREYRDTTKKSVVVVAPTGIAALNARGATIHSFFKLAPKPVNLEEIKRVP
ncbi:MAG TPA: AAA family ATPase, partial [Thermoanaerobaculia bacterium]|nr:AAA family ATPase [Thermoanaerobaculia bacterium]